MADVDLDTLDQNLAVKRVDLRSYTQLDFDGYDNETWQPNFAQSIADVLNAVPELIAELRRDKVEIKRLEAAVFDKRCAELKSLRTAKEEAEQRADRLREERDGLRELVESTADRNGELHVAFLTLQRKNEALREALRDLEALVQGESPQLLRDDSGGDGELGVRIEELLK